jgi:hypothetical protein
MPALDLNVSGFCRATTVVVPNFSVLANVQEGMWDPKAKGNVERSELMQANQPEFEHTGRMGRTMTFRKHNSFKTQNLIAIIQRGATTGMGGMYFTYYTTTFDPSKNPVTHEDNARIIDRVFDIPMLGGFDPQTEFYQRIGLQFTTKKEIYINMDLFLELNYQSLKENAIAPECPGTHDPIYSQRGYSKFSYYGYSAGQIFPKAGDLLKLANNNIMYQITSITDELPDYAPMYRNYWWKAYLEVAVDSGQIVSEEVANSPVNRHFIDNLFGQASLGKATDGTVNAKDTEASAGNPLAIRDDDLAKLKDAVLFRPPEVDECVKDITADPNYQACPGLGTW